MGIADDALMSGAAGVLAALVADRGDAASSDDFFRCQSFLAAEGVTHSLLLTEGGRVLAAAPVIVRQIPDRAELWDITSPYGYPGFKAEGSVCVETKRIQWPDGIVSVFIRDRLDMWPLSTSRSRSLVHVNDPGQPVQIRPNHRTAIRRNERAGFETSVAAGPSTGAEAGAAFRRIYLDTMSRVGAAHRHHFSVEYLNGVLDSPTSYLVTCTAPDGTPAAAAIAVLSDGWLHYFLGGTADAHLRVSPFKNAVMAMVSMAVDAGIPLNLGGGLTPGDGLDRFKRGFGNRTVAFRTSEVIAAEELYADLTAGRPSGDYFPAYRAPYGTA
jgi:Acetyltransferase (GNAT) domain